MKNTFASLVKFYRGKAALFERISTVSGSLITVLFALYNGFLGIAYLSIWHGSICVYYIFLSMLRCGLLAAGYTIKSKERDAAVRFKKTVFFLSAVALLLLNIALVVPVSLMVHDRRGIGTSLIPAIASAAYTTYKITVSAVKLKKSRRFPFYRALNVIKLIDALVSVLVLQNTLIIAVDGSISQEMFALVSASSAALMLIIFAISVIWFVRGVLSHDEEWNI